MSVLATVELPAEGFLLGKALREEGLRVRLERVVPVEERFRPYFRAADDDIETVEAALRADDDVESFEVLDRVNGETLVRAEWTEDRGGFLAAFGAVEGAVQMGVGEDGEWTLTLRFPDHEDLSALYRECLDRDVDVELVRLHGSGVGPFHWVDDELTAHQREALAAALEEGYYDVPREINLTGLADELGISDTATKQRISRGTRTVLESTLARSGSGSETEPGSGSETEPGSGSETEPGSGSETEPGSGSETEPGSGSETEPGSGSETEPGSGSETEPGSGSETDGPGDAGPE